MERTSTDIQCLIDGPMQALCIGMREINAVSPSMISSFGDNQCIPKSQFKKTRHNPISEDGSILFPVFSPADVEVECISPSDFAEAGAKCNVPTAAMQKLLATSETPPLFEALTASKNQITFPAIDWSKWSQWDTTEPQPQDVQMLKGYDFMNREVLYPAGTNVNDSTHYAENDMMCALENSWNIAALKDWLLEFKAPTDPVALKAIQRNAARKRIAKKVHYAKAMRAAWDRTAGLVKQAHDAILQRAALAKQAEKEVLEKEVLGLSDADIRNKQKKSKKPKKPKQPKPAAKTWVDAGGDSTDECCDQDFERDDEIVSGIFQKFVEENPEPNSPTNRTYGDPGTFHEDPAINIMVALRVASRDVVHSNLRSTIAEIQERNRATKIKEEEAMARHAELLRKQKIEQENERIARHAANAAKQLAKQKAAEEEEEAKRAAAAEAARVQAIAKAAQAEQAAAKKEAQAQARREAAVAAAQLKQRMAAKAKEEAIKAQEALKKARLISGDSGRAVKKSEPPRAAPRRGVVLDLSRIPAGPTAVVRVAAPVAASPARISVPAASPARAPVLAASPARISVPAASPSPEPVPASVAASRTPGPAPARGLRMGAAVAAQIRAASVGDEEIQAQATLLAAFSGPPRAAAQGGARARAAGAWAQADAKAQADAQADINAKIRADVARANAEAEARAMANTCQICMFPFDYLHRLRMVSMCGFPASRHECSMCLSCMLNTSQNRCICGRKMNIASWQRKI